MIAPATTARAEILTATTPPPPMLVAADCVPEELRLHDRWVNWRWQRRGDKWTKPPVDGATLLPIDAQNPANWRSFDAAMAAYTSSQDLGGVGFVLGDGYAGVDLDDVRDPETGEMTPEARGIVEAFSTYAEISPSGTGVKLICRGEKPHDASKAKLESAGAVEAYDHGKYFTVTGHRLPAAPEALADATDKLEWLRRRYWPAAAEAAPEGLTQDDRPAPRGSVVVRALEAMLCIRAKPGEGDSSSRLHAAACRAVEYGLDDAQAVATIKAYAIDQPFRAAYSDTDILARVRQAERRDDVVRGKHAEPVLRRRIEYARITSAELANGHYPLVYLIEDVMVEGQPLIIAGPHKSLKTSVIVDAAIALASASKFLGKYDVPEAQRVCVMSGESGLATIQETAKRVCVARGVNLGDLDNLIWSTSLPRFGDPDHLDALEEFLTADEITVLFIDPAYLAIPATDAANLFSQGALLRSMSELCQRIGVTVVLAHHTKKNIGRDSHSIPELGDVAWAGFAEFARQWWLVGRREAFMPGTGTHRLWLNVGGSAGHSTLQALDVEEGVPADPGGRQWRLVLQDSEAAQRNAVKQDAAAKRAAKEAKEAETLEGHKRAILDGAAHVPGQRGIQKRFADACGLNGDNFRKAWSALIREGYVKLDGSERAANGRLCDVYQLNFQPGRG